MPTCQRNTSSSCLQSASFTKTSSNTGKELKAIFWIRAVWNIFPSLPLKLFQSFCTNPIYRNIIRLRMASPLLQRAFLTLSKLLGETPNLLLPDLKPYFPIQSSFVRCTCQKSWTFSSSEIWYSFKHCSHRTAPSWGNSSSSPKWNTYLDACPLATPAPLRTLFFWKRIPGFKAFLTKMDIEWLEATDSATPISLSCSLTRDYRKKYHERMCSQIMNREDKFMLVSESQRPAFCFDWGGLCMLSFSSDKAGEQVEMLRNE